MSSRRRSLIDTDRLERLKDQRSTADLLAEIPGRVDEDPIPSRLSRETIVACIVHLSRSGVASQTAASMNERQLRIWLADLCDLEYDPSGDRGFDYRLEELHQIDQRVAGDRR